MIKILNGVVFEAKEEWVRPQASAYTKKKVTIPFDDGYESVDYETVEACADELSASLENTSDEDLEFNDIFANGNLNGIISSDFAAVKQLYDTAKLYQQLYCENHEFYTKEELIALVDQYRNGSEKTRNIAKDKLVMSVARFVINIASKRFSSYFANHAMDLVQEGMLGVVTSLKTFNPTTAKLTTWSYLSIMHNMSEYVNQTVHHTSSHYMANIRRIQTYIANKTEKNLSFTLDDISIDTGISLVTIENCLKIINRNQNQLSINDEGRFETNVADTTAKSPEEIVIDNERNENIRKALFSVLTKTELRVITLRVGYDDGEPKSDSDISKITDIPLSRIRKIRNEAYIKLSRYMKSAPEFSSERSLRKNAAYREAVTYLRTLSDIHAETEMFDFSSVTSDTTGSIPEELLVAAQ